MGTMVDPLPLMAAWEELLQWLFPVTARFPHRARFTFSTRIDNLALDVAEDLVEARFNRDRSAVLSRANLRIERLRLLIRLAHRERLLSTRQYEFGVRRLWEIGRMLGGWKKTAGKR